MTEVWEQISGHPLYEVSNLGNLRSRAVPGRNTKPRAVPRRINSRHVGSSGYCIVHLDGKHYQVHRLVASAFIPNQSMLPFVNHKNGDKTDNRAENLEWCTRRDNIRHYFYGRDCSVLDVPTSFMPKFSDRWKHRGQGRKKRKIMCVETGIEYESIKAATVATKIDKRNMCKAANLGHRCAGGYHWRFVDS